MKTVKLIGAVSKDGVYAKNGQLPWYIKRELGVFQQKTLGSSVVMTRPTWESLPLPLPDRENIVLSRNPSYTVDGEKIAHSVEEAIEIASSSTVWLIGGRELWIYGIHLEQVKEAWVSVIDRTYAQEKGVELFPDLLNLAQFGFVPDGQKPYKAERPEDPDFTLYKWTR